MSDHRTAGLVLAAGAGTRFGGPKGLARTADGEPWVERAVRMLTDAGCAPVLVTVGAAAAEVAALLPGAAIAVPVADWADGLSASVRAGLSAVWGMAADSALVVAVDTPDMPAAAARRILAQASSTALAQAVYDGRPGHPVLIGRTHGPALAAALSGDRGAGPYLRAHHAVRVECGDLWSGADVDSR
ncbi:MAG: nucleotidyltransferase family protein [Microbacterium sp.]|uniref:nucleotidyltransferase family protein n=1 Tax=Microbacterium sp. TaxID=51671 RepID=UPI0039E44BEB